MPRKKSKSKLQNYILCSLKANDLTQTDIARELGTSQQNFSLKLKQNRFDYEELKTIFKVFKASDEEICGMMRMK